MREGDVRRPKNYTSWLAQVPGALVGDPLWKLEAYRLALFAVDLGWFDTGLLVKDVRTKKIAGQLYRALGSVAANVAEGYARRSKRDQARLYEYALGSAREARTWYFAGRHMLDLSVVTHRFEVQTSIIRLLLRMISERRASAVHESEISYSQTTSGLEKQEAIPYATDT